MTSVKPLRAVIYGRVSKPNRNGATTSVDEQVAALRRRVADLGGTVVGVREDRAVGASGTAKHRPGWEQVLADVEAGRCTAVGLWETSRASRRLAEWARFRDLCAARGVVWITPDGIVDPGGSDRLSSGVGAVVAEHEADRTSDRIRRAVRDRAAKGQPHGRDLFGYVRRYDPATGALVATVVHPEEAATVRRIVSEALAGKPLRAIGRDLDADGILCPTRAIAARRGRPDDPRLTWTGRVLRSLLLNRAYLGLRVHVERSRHDSTVVLGQTETPAAWPALVTEAEHAALVALLSDPSRTTRPATGHEVVHWLSGVLRCGRVHEDGSTCGAAMRAAGETYICDVRTCRGTTVNKAGAEEVLAEVCVARLRRPDAAAALQPAAVDLTVPRAVLAAAEGRVDELAAAYAAGTLSLAAYGAAEAAVSAQAEEARAQIRAALTPGLPAWASGPDAADLWESWTAGQRQQVARILFGGGLTVRPSGRTGRPRKGARPVELDRFVWPEKAAA